MSAGRTLLSQFLRGTPQTRPVLLPFIDRLLARIESKPYEGIIASPGDWTAALLKIMDLLQTDGIIAGYDDATLAQAMGAPMVRDTAAAGLPAPADALAAEPLQHPGLAAAVETVKRLAAPAGRSYACIAGMAGPGKLATQLFHPKEIEAGIRAVKKPYMAVSESYLQTRPDMLLLFEDLGATGGSVAGAVARLYGTLRNQAAYYNVPLAVYFEGYHPDNMEQLSGLKPDIVILGRNIHGDEPNLALALQFADQPAGIGINLEDPERAAGVVQAACSACRSGRNLLLTGLGAPGMNADLNSLRSLFRNCAEIEETRGQE
jgi:hypothetical protein